MSTVTGSRDGVKARKRHRCCLCGEAIEVGELYDSRTGVTSEGWWTMRMHPECHAYETLLVAKNDDDGFWMRDWYEDASEPAFERPAKEKA